VITIQKKTGVLERFEPQKIIKAIRKSSNRACYSLSDEQVNEIVSNIKRNILNQYGEDACVPVLQMHNIVISCLPEDVAKAYRDYRNYKLDFAQMLDEVYEASCKIRYIGDKENSNSDSALVATKRCLVYNELSKRLYRKFFMTG
jgi:ATP cone domain.